GWATAHENFLRSPALPAAPDFILRRRASSSRSAVVKPGRPCGRSALACLTQVRSVGSVESESRATAPAVLRSPSTNRTAWALKSWSNCRRGRRLFLGMSAMGLDIVSTFRKMSTKADQAQYGTSSRSASRRRWCPGLGQRHLERKLLEALDPLHDRRPR